MKSKLSKEPNWDLMEEKMNAMHRRKAMKDCLLALSNGEDHCDLNLPAYDKTIEVKIIGVSLKNIDWKPIHVEILTKGLNKETESYEEYDGWGNDFEKPTRLVKKNVPYTEDWVNVGWLSNFKKKPGMKPGI